jgi:hypothetical protein
MDYGLFIKKVSIIWIQIVEVSNSERLLGAVTVL